jgi:hypothetical protein
MGKTSNILPMSSKSCGSPVLSVAINLARTSPKNAKGALLNDAGAKFTFENPDPSQLTPSQIDRQIDLTKQVPAKHLRHGYLMQNLGEEFEQFRPGPRCEQLNHMLNLPK